MRPHNGGYLRKRVEKNDIFRRGLERKLPVEKQLKKISKFRFLVSNTCANVSILVPLGVDERIRLLEQKSIK